MKLRRAHVSRAILAELQTVAPNVFMTKNVQAILRVYVRSALTPAQVHVALMRNVSLLITKQFVIVGRATPVIRSAVAILFVSVLENES